MPNDIIYRQEALDELERLDGIDGIPQHFMITRKSVRNMLNSLSPAHSEQQWIPVTERLPKMTDTYLVQVGINENGEGMHTEARTADWNAVWQTWYVHTTRCLVGDIIKWMPIPWEESDRHEG